MIAAGQPAVFRGFVMATTFCVLACVLIPTAVGQNTAGATRFAKSDLGRVPAGWTAAKTGEGEGRVWRVAADQTAPSKTGFALAQTAEGPNRLFNLCVLDGSSFADGVGQVHVKAVAGKIDQGGGVVWRYQDANNYYVCRYNPLESNLRLYHVKGGKRTQLATKENLSVPPGSWFRVSVEQAGNAMVCSLNGSKQLEASDATFPTAGRVGVWSKADAQSRFDQFEYTPAAGK